METSSFKAELVYTGYRATSFVAESNGVFTGVGESLVDTRTWKIPPHFAFANMSVEPRTIEFFSRKYGVLGDVRSGEWDIMPSASLHPKPVFQVNQEFKVSVSDVEDAQNLLRLAWLGDRNSLRRINQNVERGNFQVILPSEHTAPTVLATRYIWQYMCVAFILDYRAGKIRKCAFSECAATPYFIQQRKDQEFCCHACAVSATNARRAGRKK
jgi:hypothetical protein